MPAKVSDHVPRRLRAWGVDHVFGCPGDGVGPLFAAWDRAEDAPLLVRSRHAEAAALQAVGHARAGDRLGVCAASSGPDAIRLLTGLYDAKLDRVPLLAIVGLTHRAHRTASGDPQRQEADLYALFRDVATEFLETVTDPRQLYGVLDRAVRTAYARRCPAVVVIPCDVQELACDAHESGTGPTESAPWGAATVPSQEALERAAEILNSGDKAAILVGRGAAGARAEVERIAGLLGAGVAKALLGKDVLSDELAYVTGSVGPLGTRPSYELMRDCDTLLTIGSAFPYARFLPEPGRARGVRIDIEPQPAGAEFPYEANLAGDAKETLRRLIPMIRGEERGREWFDTVRDNVRRWHDVLERRAGLSADPVNPERVAHALDPLLPQDAIVTCDPGSVASWYARHVTMRPGMRAVLSGTLAPVGGAVSYAVGAKFAHPGRPVIALVGDGAMQKDGLAELITMARYRHLWRDPRLVVAVWNDRDAGRATWEGGSPDGVPSFPAAHRLPDVPYADVARRLGLTGVRVDRPEDVEEGWRTALEADGPAVVEFLTDPSVPPVPAHATWEQIEAAAASVLKGGADGGAMVRQGLRAKLQEFLPGPQTG